MKRNVAGALLSVAVFLALAAPGPKCDACRWSDRGDRFEGIKSRQVSGGCCELLGAHYQSAASLAAQAPRIYLHFWPPAPTRPEIVVWQPSANYLMIPKEQIYTAGRQSFSWPRQDVLDPLKLSTDALYARVMTPANVYLPVLLSTAEQPHPARSYRFYVESSAAFEGVSTIERESQGLLTVVRSAPMVEEFGGVFQVDWDGLDAAHKPAPPGVYALRLRGTLEGETIEKLNYVARFQHYGPVG